MDLNMEIHVAGIMENSIVDGPGMRAVLFLQGCPHHCKGCHNPETWDINSPTAETTTVSELGERILAIKRINKLTLSGGDPIMQASACLDLIHYLNTRRIELGKPKYHVILYTGYTFEQLLERKDPTVNELLSECDLVVDGPFIESEKSFDCLYRGSKNQRIINSKTSLMLGEIVLSDLN